MEIPVVKKRKESFESDLKDGELNVIL